MHFSSRAIVLNSLKYGDTSLITKLYTQSKGIISVISSISKSKRKNKSHHLLQPLTVLNVTCSNNKNQSLMRLKEVELYKEFSFSEDIIKGTIKIFIAELLTKLLKEEEANIDMFGFLESQCFELQKTNEIGPFSIQFLCELTRPLGIEPHLEEKLKYFDMLNACFVNHSQGLIALNERETAIFNQSFSDPSTLNRKERRMAIGLLLDYYRHQFSMDLKLKSLAVIDEVFS